MKSKQMQLNDLTANARGFMLSCLFYKNKNGHKILRHKVAAETCFFYQGAA